LPGSTRLLRNTENMGSGLVVLGIGLMVWSLHRFWRVSQDIERAHYVRRDRPVMILTATLILLGAVSALWLFFL
jgi:putative membrane protein